MNRGFLGRQLSVDDQFSRAILVRVKKTSEYEDDYDYDTARRLIREKLNEILPITLQLVSADLKERMASSSDKNMHEVMLRWVDNAISQKQNGNSQWVAPSVRR